MSSLVPARAETSSPPKRQNLVTYCKFGRCSAPCESLALPRISRAPPLAAPLAPHFVAVHNAGRSEINVGAEHSNWWRGGGGGGASVDVGWSSAYAGGWRRAGRRMALSVFGSWSMAQLSLRLRLVAKTRQWENFQRFMLIVVVVIWFTTVTTSVYFRLSTDTEIGASLPGESMAPGPFLPARKLAWAQR